MSSPTPPNAATFALSGGNTDAAVAARIVARAAATHARLLPSVALLARALMAMGRSPAGHAWADHLNAPLTLKTSRQLDGAKASLEAQPGLVAPVEDALARFDRASTALAEARNAVTGQGPTEAQVEALKNAAFFLSRFHELMKDDPILAQLFPPPQVLQANAAHAEESQLAGSAVLAERARKQLAGAKAPVDAARGALAALDGGTGNAWVLEHAERLRPLAPHLQRTLHAATALERALSRTDVAALPWSELMSDLSDAVDALHHDPVLRELLHHA